MKPIGMQRGVARRPAASAGGSRLLWLVVVAPLLVLPAACAIDPGYGYGYDGGGPNIGIGLDYYGGGGYDYGGWGGNYRSGPPRGGPRSFGGGDRGPHAWRSAPAGRGMPSLPSGGRGGGGGHGGGGHGGGHR